MTHLEIIRKAYDDVGVNYVVRNTDNGVTFLFLCSARDRIDFELRDLDTLCRTQPFLEFFNGVIASY